MRNTTRIFSATPTTCSATRPPQGTARLTESDDTGERTAQIASTMIGEYEYALVFFGFDEAEWKAIVDSAELAPYQNATH